MRPQRSMTKWIVIHRITVDNVVREGLVGVPAIQEFFLTDPEGVATVTFPAKGRAQAIRRWRSGEIPPYYKDRAFVPYHDLVDLDGVVTNTLDHELVGAHAYGANGTGIGIGVVGDFRTELPTDKQILALKLLLRDLLLKYPKAEVVTHDRIIELYQSGREPKDCPGQHLDVESAATWARLAADLMDVGAFRR